MALLDAIAAQCIVALVAYTFNAGWTRFRNTTAGRLLRFEWNTAWRDYWDHLRALRKHVQAIGVLYKRSVLLWVTTVAAVVLGFIGAATLFEAAIRTTVLLIRVGLALRNYFSVFCGSCHVPDPVPLLCLLVCFLLCSLSAAVQLLISTADSKNRGIKRKILQSQQ